MALDWPSSPIVGQFYPAIPTTLGRQWRWDGAGWERVVNAGQIVSVFTLVLDVDQTLLLPVIPTSFVLLTHI